VIGNPAFAPSLHKSEGGGRGREGEKRKNRKKILVLKQGI
jgi:hypothetical protein